VSDHNAVRYCFGRFELQPGERRLLASGTAVAITPRAFDLLVVLLERNGRLVTKEDLLAQVWPGVIVEENALHAQISALRKLLGPEVITTVPGTGYRLGLDVTPIQQETKSHAAGGAEHNLPKALTSFVGREQQLGELKGLLRQTRLLTLTGAGGCGKTRLALELATQVSDAYTDGVWLVEFADLADGLLVPQTVADALGLKARVGESFTDALLGHLASRHLLLVLDNAEHLLAACAELARTLLQRCARLTVLVTSRERLGVLGELTYRVPSLSVPDADQKDVVETLIAYESARLFVERARLQQPHFAVTAQSAPAIASICATLDGIPLAIELAAARVRALSVAEVNKRLDQRFGLLTDGSRSALPRHRTLRSMLDWSYDLLNEEEKAVFCRASVFAGGFTLDAAERVLSGAVVNETAILDLLTSLADKSLLHVEEHAGATRYRQLETVRQYGRDRLRESDDESSWERRHLDHFLALAEAAEDGLRGGERQAWLQRLEAEHENLRAALAFASVREGDRVGGLRLAGALFPFWLYSAYWSEGRAWLSRFLDAVPPGATDSVRAKALNAAGALADYQGDRQYARSVLEQTVALRRKLGDRRGLAATLINLANVLDSTSDSAAARALLEESLAILREIKSRWGILRALNALADVVLGQGHLGLARALAEECVDIARGELDLLPDGLNVLAWVVLEEGDAEAAAALCRDAFATETVDRLGAQYLLDTAACADCALGNSIRAAVTWGHAERIHQDTRMSPSRLARLRHERSVASARAALGDDAAFDAAWRRGGAMTTEQAIAFVLRPSDT
jgi:non-specific serine/threonine protein kinase